MKRFAYFSFFLIFTVLFWGCDESSTGSSDGNLTSASTEKNFVWNAMNYWYYWQADVPELADDKSFFDGQQDFQDYLIAFEDAEAVFEDLLFNEDNFGMTVGEDDFSFFIDDYEEFQQSRQGISQSFGFEYGLVRLRENSNNLFGYVQYVLEGTPADNAGLNRGDIFTGINGTVLTVNNYQSLLSNSTYDLTIAEPVDGTISETGETITVPSEEITENPIYLSKVIDTGSAKVGYLMYNSFQANSHENLNNVFGDFVSAGVDELVLDLRYNGGGAVITSATLASMISGLGGSEDFAVYTHNSKRTEENGTVTFQDQVLILDENFRITNELPINTLSIDRLYVLTGFGTASASEAVINGLRPFMDVILIGRQTVGKDDASITLYDAPAPYTNKDQANESHKNAIQPIVLKVKNTEGESNSTGFIPQHPLNEISFLLQNGNLPLLGDENEPLLATALQLISGEPVSKALAEPVPFGGDIFKDSRDLEQFGKDMYLLPEK